MSFYCLRLVWVVGLVLAQDLFLAKEDLAQRGLALQIVDVNKTGLRPQVGHDFWVFQITLMSNNNLCMDLTDESAPNGAPIQIWTCNGHESQLWFFDDASYTISWAGNSGKCLDAGDQQEGTQVYIWDCLGNDAQTWGYDGQAIFLQNSASDATLCLDVTGGAMQEGTPLEIWGCNLADQQQYYLQSGITMRSFQNWQMCLDLPGGDTTNGVPLWFWECNGGGSQYWVFDSDNSRILYNGDTSKCIDAGDVQAGSALMLWDCNGNPSQGFGYDASMGTLYASESTQGDATLCVDISNGALWNGGGVGLWDCNSCWNQQFQVWGPSSAMSTQSKLMLEDPECPEVPGGPTPGASNVFPSSYCDYDTGSGWPVFNSYDDLANDVYWGAYVTRIYGAVPAGPYPFCPGGFQFLWILSAKATGVSQNDPTDCSKPHLPTTSQGEELPDGTFYTGMSFLEARDVYGYIYNTKLYGASVPENYWVEVTHSVFPGDKGAVWYYMSVGSGVWYNVGKTKVYQDHSDGVQDMLKTSCKDEAQDTFGKIPTECEKNFPDLYKQGASMGLDSIQFTSHHDCTCGPEGTSSYKYNRWCPTEIIALGDSTGGGNGCSNLLAGGWQATANCNCQESFKSKTRDGKSVSYANCGAS